jgi:hypothetical protein
VGTSSAISADSLPESGLKYAATPSIASFARVHLWLRRKALTVSMNFQVHQSAISALAGPEFDPAQPLGRFFRYEVPSTLWLAAAADSLRAH